MADKAFSSEDEFFKATGLKDFSTVQVLAPGQTPTGQVYRYNNAPTVYQNGGFDPNAERNSSLARRAGQAGIGFDDLRGVLTPGPDGAQEAEIRKGLGIDGLETKVFTPAPSTEKLFTDAYGAAGLAELKTQIQNIINEQGTTKQQLNERLSKVNENPWLSESSRLASAGNTKNFFEGTLNTQSEKMRALQALFDSGMAQVSDLVTRKTTDFSNQQAIDQAQLNYLLQNADKEIANRKALDASKIARYLPDFLTGKANSKAPDTIKSDDGAIFQWDVNTGKFVEIRSGTAPVEKWKKEVLSPSEAEKLGVPYGTTKGQASEMGITPQAPLSTEAIKLQGNVQSGLRALDTVKNELFGAGSAGKSIDHLNNVRSNIIVRERSGMARNYAAARNEMMDIVVRLRTGAAISEQEEKFYKSQLPTIRDNEHTVKEKLKRFEELFKSIAPERIQGMTVPDTDALFNEFEVGGADKTSLKPSQGSKTAYLSTLGPITAYGSPLWKPGLDVDLKKGDPVRSPVSGTVIDARTNGGFGLQVKIKGDDGREVWLSHLDAFQVTRGQKVAAGQPIGTGGNSGRVIKGKGGDGSHLDITIPNGTGGYLSAKEVENYLNNIYV